tara:strand:+ start:1002 stop:3323 length:2322 start_codon:yes stop_codon:yes gene_type:complete
MAVTKTSNPFDTIASSFVRGVGSLNESMTEKRLSEQRNSAAAQEIAEANNINRVNELQDYFVVENGYFALDLNKGDDPIKAFETASRVIKGTEVQSYINGKLETVVMDGISADPDNEGFFIGTAKNKKGEIVPITIGGTDDPDDQVANITQDQIEKQLGSSISRDIARSKKSPRQLSGILRTLGGPPSLSQSPNTQNSEQEAEQVIARTALSGKKENAVIELLEMQLAQDLKENPNMSAGEQEDLNRRFVAATRNVKSGLISETDIEKLGASYYGGDASKFTASLNKKEQTLPTRETYIPEVVSERDKVTGKQVTVPSSGGTRDYTKKVTAYLETFKEFTDLGGDPELLTGRFKEGILSRRAAEGGKTLLLEKVMGAIGDDAQSLFALQGTLDKARRNLLDSEGEVEKVRTKFSDEEITAIVATTLDAKKASAIIGEDLDGVSPTEFVDSANKLGLFSTEENFVAEMSAKAKQVATDKGLTNIQDVARLNAWEAYTIGVATALASPAAEGSTDFNNIIVGMMNIAAGRPFDETAATKAVIQNKTLTTQEAGRTARRTALVKGRGDAAKALKDFRETQMSVDEALDLLKIPTFTSGLSSKIGLSGGRESFEANYSAAATALNNAIEQSKAIVANASDGVTIFGSNQLKALAGQQQRLMEQTFRFGLYSDTGGKLEGLRELFKGGRVPQSLYSYENMNIDGRDSETGAITDATTVRWNNQEQDLTYGEFRRMVGTELARSTFNFLANLKDYDKATTAKAKQALLLRNNQFDEPAE